MGSIFGGSTNTHQTTSNTSTSQQQQQQTQQGSNSSTGSFANSTTPNIPAWYSSFLSSLPGQYQSLASTLGQQTTKPLYGQPQQAAFQNNLNQTQGQSLQTLMSQLASRGALNSGQATQAQTGLALGGQQQLSNYLAAVPQMNQQASLAASGQLSSLLNGMAGFTSPISAFGTSQSGTQQQQSLSSLLSQLLGSSNTGSQGSTNTSVSSSPGLLGDLSGIMSLIPGVGQLGSGILNMINPMSGSTSIGK